MKDNFLIKCEYRCWCEYCGEEIEKGEKYLVNYKSAQKGVTRTNICLVCLNKINNEIKKKDVTKIIKRRILNKLSDGKK